MKRPSRRLLAPLYGRRDPLAVAALSRTPRAPVHRAYGNPHAPALVAVVDGRAYTAAMLERRAERIARWDVHARLEAGAEIVWLDEAKGKG